MTWCCRGCTLAMCFSVDWAGISCRPILQSHPTISGTLGRCSLYHYIIDGALYKVKFWFLVQIIRNFMIWLWFRWRGPIHDSEDSGYRPADPSLPCWHIKVQILQYAVVLTLWSHRFNAASRVSVLSPFYFRMSSLHGAWLMVWLERAC